MPIVEKPPKIHPLNDNSSEERPAAKPARTQLGPDLISALRFFSRLPAGNSPHIQPDLSRIAMALPIASVIIALPACAFMIFLHFVGAPAPLTAALGLTLKILVTGAMHEDAAADSADGLLGGQSIEQRLAIMRDSTLGTYGVVTIALSLLIRWSALTALLVTGPITASIVWIGSLVAARSLGLWVSHALLPVRTDGISASARQAGRRPVIFGSVVAGVLVLIFLAPLVGISGVLAASLLGIAVLFGWIRICERLTGGQTGDLIGAGMYALEIAFLSVFVIFAS